MNDDILLKYSRNNMSRNNIEPIIFSSERVELLAFKNCANELTAAEKKEFVGQLTENPADAEAYLNLKRLENINDPSAVNKIPSQKISVVKLKNECKKIFNNKLIIFHFNIPVKPLYYSASSAKLIENPLDFRMLHNDKLFEIAAYLFKSQIKIKILNKTEKLKKFDVFFNKKKLDIQQTDNETTAEITVEKFERKNLLVVKTGKTKIETEIMICRN